MSVSVINSSPKGTQVSINTEKSVSYISSENKDLRGDDPLDNKKQEESIDLNKLQNMMSDYSEKKELSSKIGLPYGLPIDTFSELGSPLTVKIHTTFGKRLASLKSKEERQAGLVENVTDKAEVLVHAAGKLAATTEKKLFSLTENTGSIINSIITEPIHAAREKINEAIDFANTTKEFTENIVHEAVNIANKSTNFILHIPGLASEAIGNKVAKVYEKAGRKLGKRVEPITNTLANVSRVLGHSVHNFSDNISAIVGEVMFPNDKDK